MARTAKRRLSGRRGGWKLQREVREHLLVGLLHEGAQERFAGLEVVVEHAEVHARGIRDLAHRKRRAAALGKSSRPAASRAWSRFREGRGMRVVTIRLYSYDVKAPEVICFSQRRGPGFPVRNTL
jgi:hypothetical protein